MRKTKIVCTLGPASTSYDQIKKMALAGMNVARINMSHGTYEEHQVRVDNVKKVRRNLGVPIPIMVDTKGPEIRIGTFESGKIEVTEGMTFDFVAEDVIGDDAKVSITYKELHKDISVGCTVLLNDGLLVFKVTDIIGSTIRTEAQNSGTLTDRKGLFVPNVKLNIPFLSEQDKRDLEYGVKIGAEMYALSFVQDGECVKEVRKFLTKCGAKDVCLISKIESQSGVDNIDEIIAASDGIMVARGDLGVELPYEKLPAIQKLLITKSRMSGKFVITATEMLESMVTKLRPTRAEIVDVANAVYDGSSCVMLSAESAVGINPSNTIATMARIAEEAERNVNYRQMYTSSPFTLLDNTDAISHATVNTAFDINAKAIVVYTASGVSARMISRFRPEAQIVAMTNSDRVYHQLATSWGVIPSICQTFDNTDDMFINAEETVRRLGLAKGGDNVVITAGVPLGKNVGTNLIKVGKIEED
ncbi:MAG: pyruvate kinase [Corallococcus sp.]|nr:pyruvate kinase [Corallococcus sp.]MCM1359936.1 pyruvate kinase [Corallococcus sp.]MCM1395492.1 pyruvate kinase [Corallococcus sp.]